MTEQTELLIKDIEVMSKTSRLYDKLNSILGGDSNFNQVLYALFMEEGLTQKQISTDQGLPPQTVNNIVLSMQKKGQIQFIENPNDKRSKIIKFTEKGLEIAKKQIGPIVEIEKKSIIRMGLENYQKMIELEELYYSSLKAEIENYSKEAD